MKRGIVLSPLARRDLIDIWESIATDDLAAADRVVDAIEEAMNALSAMPAMGHFRDELADRSHRFWPVGRYLIVYHHEMRPIEIVRVLHGARDVERLL
jgi:toxin ParE1/3/4